MDYEILKTQLSQGVGPVYMINGGESYLTTTALKIIENACNITMPDFNVAIIGDDYKGSAIDIVTSCEAMPFADEKRLIIVHDYVGKKNESEKKPNKIVDFLIQ